MRGHPEQEPRQASNMEFFEFMEFRKIVNGFEVFIIFPKSIILHVLLSFEYASVFIIELDIIS